MKLIDKPTYQLLFDDRQPAHSYGLGRSKEHSFGIKTRTLPEKLLLAVTLGACVTAIGWANRPKPIEQLGLNQLHQGAYAQAAATLQQSLDVHGQSLETYLGLSSAANQRGEYFEALKYADQALSFYQSEPAAWAERANANLGMQNYRAAISDTQQSLSIQPHNQMAIAIQHRALLLLAHDKETTFSQ